MTDNKTYARLNSIKRHLNNATINNKRKEAKEDKDDRKSKGKSTGKKMANNTTAAKLIVNEEDANLSEPEDKENDV